MSVRVTAAAIAVISLSLYCLTLAPGLTFIDSGELAAVCSTAGIAHPTGYPLFTILGYLFTRIIPGRDILLLNFLSSLWACATLTILFLLCRNIFFQTGSEEKCSAMRPVQAVALGAGVLLLGFSRVFWAVALETEVYALQAFCTAFVMLAACRVFCSEGRIAGPWNALLFFSLGLSFCNHMSTVLLVPALMYLAFASRRTWYSGWKKLSAAAGFFLLGLTPYAYLPLRAATKPTLNWGNPSNWETFLWHIGGKQYRVWMFASLESAIRQANYFVSLVLDAFGYVPIVLIPFGIWHLFHRNRRMCWFLIILFVSDVAYAINYDINDIDAYFLPAFMVCGIWMASALLYGVEVVSKKSSAVSRLVMAGLCLLFVLPLGLHYRAVDQSSNRLVEQYVDDILKSVERKGIILSYQWDYFCSPFYYVQRAENRRPDVCMIEVKLLKRSWYLKQLENNHPEVAGRSRDELERYARELYKFEHNLPYRTEVIQTRYEELITSFVKNNIADRPVYITCEQEALVDSGFKRVPVGLVFRLYPPEQPYVRGDFSLLGVPDAEAFKPGNRYHDALRSFYAFMFTTRGIYEMRYGNREATGTYIQTALGIVPGYPLARKALSLLNSPER